MASILQQVGTPLQLVALFLILIAGVARLLVRAGTLKLSPLMVRLVVNRIFVAALAALVLGTASGPAAQLIDRWLPGDEMVHGVVLSTTSEPVPNATVNLLSIASVTTNATGQFDIVIPRNRMRKDYTLQVKATGYQTPGEITRKDTEMHDIAIRLTPAPDELVKAFEPGLVVGHYYGTPFVVATFRVENAGSSIVTINEISGTLSGPTGTLTVSPASWTILNPFGPFALMMGPIQVPAGFKVDLRVVLAPGVNFGPLYSRMATLPEYRSQPPCIPRANAPTEPMTEPGFAIVKAFALDHFGWADGDWHLQLRIATDTQSKSYQRDFTLAAPEIERLRNSISLLRQCQGINMGAPLAQDGTMANFLTK